ncbi:hypothetical protein [Streptomyces phaeoluteigriseus]|uniref:hypothetical protein n=1 Tax=Streptomyces phaeoluteigriseus TaxID=114686 RepID=UPI0036CE465A
MEAAQVGAGAYDHAGRQQGEDGSGGGQQVGADDGTAGGFSDGEEKQRGDGRPIGPRQLPSGSVVQAVGRRAG